MNQAFIQLPQVDHILRSNQSSPLKHDTTFSKPRPNAFSSERKKKPDFFDFGFSICLSPGVIKGFDDLFDLRIQIVIKALFEF